MKLSLAIRLGAMLRPQVKHVMHDKGGSCAMGAAMEATGHGCEPSSKDVNAFLALYPLLHDRWIKCPVCEVGDLLFEIIGAHLNDLHGWTREAIADVVESIEPQEAGCAEEVRQGQEEVCQ